MYRDLGAKAGVNLPQPAEETLLFEWSHATQQINLTVKHRGLVSAEE